MIWVIVAAVALSLILTAVFLMVLIVVSWFEYLLSYDEPARALQRDINTLKLEMGRELLPVVRVMMESMEQKLSDYVRK